MGGQHLLRRGRYWYYHRRRPARFEDVEPRKVIHFSLRTTDFSSAKLMAAQHSLELDEKWCQARALGRSRLHGGQVGGVFA